MAKVIMIEVAEEVKKKLQTNMLNSFIDADTQSIEKIELALKKLFESKLI